MIKSIFIIVVIFYFISEVIIENYIANAQFDKFSKRHQQENTLAVVNMTDPMKYFCIKIDASGSIDRIQDKEQQAQCKTFLDIVGIHELKELIQKYQVEKLVN